MKKLSALLIILPQFINKTYSQCEVKSYDFSEKYNMFYMSEIISVNEDLENGVREVIFHANCAKEKISNKNVVNILVVTYAYSGDQSIFTPGQFVITLSNGENITLTAKSKLTSTLNMIPNATKIHTVEGIFYLTSSESLKLMGNDISTALIIDLRLQLQMDVTPKYKHVLAEMLTCIDLYNK